MEERIPGEICSWIIISRRKMSVEICLGDIFSGENCESLEHRHYKKKKCNLFYDWSTHTLIKDPQSLDFCDDCNCHFVLTAAFMLRCFVLIGESASNLPMKYISKSI